MKHTQEELRALFLKALAMLPRDKKGNPCCPVCGSGTGKKGTSALSVDVERLIWHCNSAGCGAKGGALALAKACGIALPDVSQSGYRANLAGRCPCKGRALAIDYLRARGLPAEVAINAGCGCDDAGNIAFPRAKGWFLRGRDEKKATKGAQGWFFCERANAPACIVCEGEIDALSLYFADFSALALGGVERGQGVADFLRSRGAKNVWLLCDDDDAGANAVPGLLAQTGARGALDASAICDDAGKDANDVLLRFGVDGLRARVQNALEGAPVAGSLASKWDALFDGIFAGQKPAISTGVSALDKGLNGGLRGGMVYVLGGTPGRGKTTLSLQIAQAVAGQGRAVRFFSFEQGAGDLFSAIVSREVFLRSRAGKIPVSGRVSSSDVSCDFPRLTPAQQDAVRAVFRDGFPGKNRLEIRGNVEALSVDDFAGAEMVIVDSLQECARAVSVKAPPEIDSKKIMAQIMENLRAFARQTGAVVLAISTLNRASYAGATIAGFSGASEIEFMADSALQILSRDGIDKGAEWDALRLLDLHILKNRKGAPGRVPLDFYAPCACFGVSGAFSEN